MVNDGTIEKSIILDRLNKAKIRKAQFRQSHYIIKSKHLKDIHFN